MHRESRMPKIGALLLLLAVGLLRAEEATVAAPPSTEDWVDKREKTFSTVWETVNESYYDATFGGVDWRAVREKYHGDLAAVSDNDGLRRLLQRMLGELRRTHFAIMPREAAVFTPGERVRIGTAGVEVAYVEDRVAVAEIKAGFAAARQDLHPGDTIRRIDNIDLGVMGDYLKGAGCSPARCGFHLTQFVSSRLRSAVGTKVTLTVCGLDGAERSIELICEANEGPWSEPMGGFPSLPVECTVRHLPDRIDYLHFNIFVRPIMKEVKSALKSVPVDGALVIDLRGNIGGISIMASGISGWLSDHEFSLGTMHMRQGHIGFTVSPQTSAFLGPVAVLIDSGSASTSEIMAAGLQESGRARIFGEASPGAALPSQMKTLPTGDLLQYAVADVQTPKGVLIEGRGVTPDQAVKPSLADLAAGRDPVLDAAQQWLKAVRRHPASPPAGQPQNQE